MRSVMVQSLTSMTVSTPNDMYQVVGALALATSEPSEVSRQSQVSSWRCTNHRIIISGSQAIGC